MFDLVEIIRDVSTATLIFSAEDEGVVRQSNYDPCVECTCTEGSWLCDTQTCPPIDCPSSELLTEPDKCCPTCAGCYTDTIRQVW